MAQPQKRGQEYKIDEAVITADRLGKEYDVKNLIGEISFFEHLEKPYVTAQIAIMDDRGVINEVNFRGTELITITISAVDEDLVAAGLTFTHTFNMVSIVKQFKTAERTEVYVFKCIDPHAYADANIKLSKSYTGKLEEIAQSICINHLPNIDIDLSYSINSVQDPVRVILPYISPLQSAKWLLDRATSKTGCPYYIWATLYDQEPDGSNKLRIGNLETMFKAPVFNQDLPYLFSTSLTNKVAELPIEQQAVIVKELKLVDQQNTLKLVDEAAVGAMMTSVDTFTSQKYQRHFSVRDLIIQLENEEVIPFTAIQNVFDEEQQLEIDKKKVYADEVDARYVNTITSYGTYGTVNSYHDVQDQVQALNKLRASAIKSLLMKNMIDVTIPGIAFFAALKGEGKGVSVGDIVRVDFLNSNVDIENSTEKYDTEKSGYYLIYSCRNTYRDTTHDITLSITKLADRPA